MRCRRIGELDRDARGGDPLQGRAIYIIALDAVDFKIETDNCVGVIFLRFADQRPDGRQTIGLAARRAPRAPSGGRLDAADRIMPATPFEFIGVTDLHHCYRRYAHSTAEVTFASEKPSICEQSRMRLGHPPRTLASRNWRHPPSAYAARSAPNRLIYPH